MKKLILTLLLLTSGCTSLPFVNDNSPYGMWCGPVLMFNVYMYIGRDEYEVRSYSANMVHVGGNKGIVRSVDTDKGSLNLKQTHSYDFNMGTNTGEYIEKTNDYLLDFKIVDGVIYLTKHDESISMYLPRCKE